MRDQLLKPEAMTLTRNPGAPLTTKSVGFPEGDFAARISRSVAMVDFDGSSVVPKMQRFYATLYDAMRYEFRGNYQ